MNQPLNTSLVLRLTADEKQKLRNSASLAGLGLSEYVRRRIYGHQVSSRTDEAVVRELRRIGGLLKHVHVESNGAYSQQTADTLTVLRDCIERIGRGAT